MPLICFSETASASAYRATRSNALWRGARFSSRGIICHRQQAL